MASNSSANSTLNDHGLIIVPRCADPAWVAEHGSPTVDIVAIHGLNGKRWSTWTYKAKGKPDVMWLQDLLPEKLPQARVMTFGYNADMIKNYSTLGIREHAQKLLSLLRNKRDEGDQSSRPIIFLCHSLGGIVAKQALRIATNETPYNPIAISTRGIVFMGTPHRGSDLAFWGDIFAGIAKAAFLNPSKNIKDLKNNSSTLMNVSADFRSIVGKYYIVSFYEDTKIKGISKEVVGKHSAVMEIPGEEATPLEGNHMEICTFSGIEDPKFEEVWKAIKRAIDSKPDKISDSQYAFMDRLAHISQFDHMRFLKSMPSPLEGTFKWVVGHPTYRSWIDCAGSSILHIIGKQGCGKSTISKHLLEDSKARLDWIASGYFGFSATEGRRNLIQVYSSFLLQILAFAPSMYPHLIGASNAHPKGDWDEWDLQILFEQALAIFPRRCIILVLDALDECDAFGSEVLGSMVYLSRKAPWCKIIVTSRPNEATAQEDIISILNLDKEAGLEGDVKLFIADRVNRLLKARPFFGPLKSEILKRLNDRAGGMFLLVEHIYRDLLNQRGTSRKSIRETLGSLPKTIEDAYARIFDRVLPEEREFVKSVLVCMLYSSRLMTERELAVAVAITDKTSSFSSMADDIALSILHDVNIKIGPIITANNDIVSLVHASIRDFLLSTYSPDQNSKDSGAKKTAKWYMIDKDEGNKDLLSRCMRYLDLWNHGSKPAALVPTSQKGSRLMRTATERESIEDSESGLNDCLEFLLYAVENFPDHVRKISATSTKERQRVKEFFLSDRFAEWKKCYWTIHDPPRIEETIDPVAMACLLGLELTVEDLVPPGFDFYENIPYNSRNCIESAIEGGTINIVKFLISRGADVNAIIKEEQGRTLLSAAVWYGRIEIIELLLEKSERLSLHSSEGNGYTAIDVAVEAGRQAMVRWLQAQGASLNIGSNSWRTRAYPSLQVAILSRRSEMIPLLFELGADSGERSRAGDLAFHLAAGQGDVALMEILRPENIDERGADEDTALLRASKCLQKGALLYLLREGANINVRNKLGDIGSAVHLTLSHRPREEHRRAQKVMALLLQNGADITFNGSVDPTVFDAVFDSDNVDAFSFLKLQDFPLPPTMESPTQIWRLAYGKGAFAICSYLLEAETVDVNTADESGATALHVAAEKGNFAFCLTLISKYDASPTILDNEGRTPLHSSFHDPYSEVRTLPVIRVLLDHGNRLVDIKDKSGTTALHLAVDYGYVEVAGLLLQKSAAVDAVDDNGNTPFHYYSKWQNEMAILLLEAGATPTVQHSTGKSVAMTIAEYSNEKTLEVLFRAGFPFQENDVLDIVVNNGKEEKCVHSLLWNIYHNGDHELAKNMMESGCLREEDKKAGVKWALSHRSDSVLEFLSPTLGKRCIQGLFGTELVNWLAGTFRRGRKEVIHFILQKRHELYLNLNESYLGDQVFTYDVKPLNPLIEAAERGELEFVEEMLKFPMSGQVKVLAAGAARREKHEEVAKVIERESQVRSSRGR